MDNSLLALQVKTPDVVGAYQQGRESETRNNLLNLTGQAKQQDMQLAAADGRRKEFQDMFQMLGAGAMHALGGNINGQVDPAKWNEIIDTFDQLGLDAGQYRNFPQMAPVLAQASVSALDRLRMAKTEQDMMQQGQRFDMDLADWIKEQNAGSKAPTVTTLFDEGTGQEYKAQWNPQTGEFDRVGGVKAPSGMTLETRPDGSVTMTQGNVKGGSPKLTEQQAKSLGLYDRAASSIGVLEKHAEALTNFRDSAGANLPAVGNYMKSPEYQQAENAGRQFLQAILRLDSGAALTPDEIKEYGDVYIDRPGDSTEVRKQKAASRRTALEALRKGLGPAQEMAVDRPPVNAETKIIDGVEYTKNADGDWEVEAE